MTYSSPEYLRIFQLSRSERSHLYLRQKCKTIGCYCSFYTEYEQEFVYSFEEIVIFLHVKN